MQVWSAGEYPMWSPTGACVAFTSRVANFGVHCVRLDGTGDEQMIPVALSFSDWWAPRASDSDRDGIADAADNCPNVANPNQLNTDGDAEGDACDADDDNDRVSDAAELAAGSDPLNAASTPEVCDGVDNDLDGQVDETCDADGDGVIDAADNCPAVANSNQTNTDRDAQGDACDTDDDNDGFSDVRRSRPDRIR